LAAAAAERLTGPATSVLDVGCGTGVLAVIAALRGAAPVVAIDIAEAAREAALANAARNGVAGRIDVSTTPLADVPGTFDVVFANILAPTLVALADGLRAALAPGGTLVISGVLDRAYDHVLAALAPLTVVGAEVYEGWAAVELRR
jgi:ribosomal protein L11 methyltransferase